MGAWLSFLLADADTTGPLSTQIPVEMLDPLILGPLPETSARTYADTAMLTRILLREDRRADAEAVVARLGDFAARHPGLPFLECAALHARAVLDADPDTALRAVSWPAPIRGRWCRRRWWRTPGDCCRIRGWKKPKPF